LNLRAKKKADGRLMNREHHWELCHKKIKPLHAVPHLAATL